MIYNVYVHQKLGSGAVVINQVTLVIKSYYCTMSIKKIPVILLLIVFSIT